MVNVGELFMSHRMSDAEWLNAMAKNCSGYICFEVCFGDVKC